MTISTGLKKSGLKKRGLGKALSHLLSENFTDNFVEVGYEKKNNQNINENNNNEKIMFLSTEKLQSGKYQPRQNFTQESLEDLAESIRAQGILQPVIVRKIAGQNYEIIAGERRFRAAKLAGLTEIPVVIKNIADKAAIAMALIENIQRENLNAIEEALSLKKLQTEFNLTQQQVAQAVGRSRVGITHLLRLLDLHPEIQKHLQSGKIEKGHAKVLLALKLQDQLSACQMIISKDLSVRETEKLLQTLHFQVGNNNKSSKKISDPNITALEKQLADQLHTPVMIQHHQKKNRGKLIIHYRNLDVLDKILGKLKD